MAVTGRDIRIRGQVQGVGFRPHVWRLAVELGLAGHVLNDGQGVTIHAWGPATSLDVFLDRITARAPPMAAIRSVEWQALSGASATGPFRIAASMSGAVSTGIAPDAATCAACLADIRDPDNRRFGYAFTNCTDCGPRLSIVRAVPYDRASTSMAGFDMCPDCGREYRDPANRRFHAQPNACPVCGPRLWVEDHIGPVASADPLADIASHLRTGGIAAIKGIGGFHLACDASSHQAVTELRHRKRRPAKPFALMARDLAQIRRFATVSAVEADLLASPAAPIVLLQKSGECLAPGVAPGQDRIGFLLPYSPMHHLLLDLMAAPIVLTSGNPSDEPQAISNETARSRLAGIADRWLMHDRDIVNRLDDSVLRLDASGPAVLRRARGFAPAALSVDLGQTPTVLAMGGTLKSTFCLLKDGQATPSQHLGDLENAVTYSDYRKTVELYRQLFRFDPDCIAVDLHADYLSAQWGRALAAEIGARLVSVQHHHAHMASCLAEHGLAPGAEISVGIILDGLGVGTDGALWGGEILVGGYAGFRRAAHFQPVALPGGDQAARQPWRNTVAHLAAAFGDGWRDRVAQTPLRAQLSTKPLDTIQRMIDRGVNAPPSSSAGRLFDAVAGAIGLCPDDQSYEGQAAMELEAVALPHLVGAGAYPVAGAVVGGVKVLSWAPLWQALLSDLSRGSPAGLIAARFILGLATGLADTAAGVADEAGIRRVVLSGGVMQNRVLVEALRHRLTAEGFDVLVHAQIPANDGGLSLGQAVIAASH